MYGMVALDLLRGVEPAPVGVSVEDDGTPVTRLSRLRLKDE